MFRPLRAVARIRGNVEVLSNVMQTKEFYDAAIFVDGEMFDVHRIVLSAGSEYFKELLNKFQSPVLMPILVITDIKKNHIELIIEWIYHGQIDVPSAEIDEFFQAAKKLKIHGLTTESMNDLSDGNESTHENDSPNVRVTSKNQQPSEQHNGHHESLEKSTTSSNENPSKRARSVNGRNNKSSDIDDSRSSTPSSTADSTQMRYRCDNKGCTKVCTSSQELIRHQKRECGKERRFQCDKCFKRFRLFVALNHHRCLNTQ